MCKNFIDANKSIVHNANLNTEEGVEKFLHVDDYIIQLWTKLDDPDVTDIISKGYRTIFSPWDRFYLDCGYSAWVGDSGKNWCSPYKGWQLIYGTRYPRIESVFQMNESCLFCLLPF